MIAELTAFAELSKRLISLVKEVSDALPDGARRENIERELKLAERELALAEASTARELGYELCQCTFPPQIMLFTGKGRTFKCPNCKHEVDKSMAVQFYTNPREWDGF